MESRNVADMWLLVRNWIYCWMILIKDSFVKKLKQFYASTKGWRDYDMNKKKFNIE